MKRAFKHFYHFWRAIIEANIKKNCERWASNFNKQNFRHGLLTTNPMCACGTEIETTEYFFLHSQFYSTQRLELFKSLKKDD